SHRSISFFFFFSSYAAHRDLHSFPTRRSSDLGLRPDLAESLDALKPAFLRFPGGCWVEGEDIAHVYRWKKTIGDIDQRTPLWNRSEEHTSELQSRGHLVCRLLLEKKKKITQKE